MDTLIIIVLIEKLVTCIRNDCNNTDNHDIDNNDSDKKNINNYFLF